MVDFRIEFQSSTGGVGQPILRLGAEVIHEGDQTDVLRRVGLEKVAVHRRLLQIVVLLALRRAEVDIEAWTTADELALLLTPPTSAAGIGKFLERRLRPYLVPQEDRLADEALPVNWLIQYRPCRSSTGQAGGRVGGLSRGPYRLGVPARQIKLDATLCWAYLLGTERIDVISSEPGAGALEAAQALAAQGRYFETHVALHALLRNWHLRRPAWPSGTAALAALNGAWDLLANVNLQLGMTSATLHAAQRALLYAQTRRAHPAMAHAHLIQAFAWGQLGKPAQALEAARMATRLFEPYQARARGWPKMEYRAATAQFMAQHGMPERAEPRLRRAEDYARQLPTPGWAATMALRQTQSALSAGRLGDAAQSLARAQDYGGPLDVAQHALLARVTSEFLLTSGDGCAAANWARHAKLLAESHRMHHQIRTLQPLLQALALRGFLVGPDV